VVFDIVFRSTRIKAGDQILLCLCNGKMVPEPFAAARDVDVDVMLTGCRPRSTK